MNKILNKINKGVVLTACGIGVTITGVVLAKKANIKAIEIINEHNENKECIEQCSKDLPEEKYSIEDKENDLKINNIQTSIKLVKVYSVPVVFSILGSCMTVKGIRKIYNGGV